MRKLNIWMVIFLVLTPLLSGCWNRRELNELAIAVGVGLDKKGDNYLLSVQVADTGAVAHNKSAGGPAVTLYQIEAGTVYEAFRRLTTLSPRRIYPSHLRILIIGEDLAREGIAKSLDLLARDWELRSDFFMTVARGDTAENVLKVLTPFEQIPANKLYKSLKTSEKLWAPTKATRLDDFVNDFMSDGKQPVISGIQVIGNAEKASKIDNLGSSVPAARLRYSNLAVFKEDKLIGWLDEQESKGYNYITDNVASTVGLIGCPDSEGNVNVEIIRSSSSMKGAVRNGKPVIDVTILSTENIGEVECSINLLEDKNIKKLEALAAKKTVEIMNDALKKSQKLYKSDIFGFGNAIHRADKQYWKKHKDHWADIYPNVEVNFHVKIVIREVGTTNNSILHNKKEGTS
jgi:spore germination protein KC